MLYYSYASQTAHVVVKRNAPTSTKLNFTLSELPDKDWSLQDDYGILDNIAIHSFTNLKPKNVKGFATDNLDIIDYREFEGLKHLVMTDQVK